MLYEESVTNLNGPILATSSITTSDETDRLGGVSIRAKTCNFVRTRLISTNHFLSMQHNADDACIIFNRCFEQFAQLCRQSTENPWIKPVYTTPTDKHQAEQAFQNKVFNLTDQRLAESKKFINSLQLQSELQNNLEEYRFRMPILIEFRHFRTQLSHEKNHEIPLTILRRLLDDFDFLQMTKYIYDLSQFHLLLHRTYNQLIEREEFLSVTLNELYQRAHRETIQSTKDRSTIDRGIKAVNAYHAFADGLIRPGACDQTQRFQTISIDTRVHYLVDTGNSDEGDIIMRILR